MAHGLVESPVLECGRTYSVTGFMSLTAWHMVKVKGFSRWNEDSCSLDLLFTQKEIILGGPELIRGAL